MMRYDLDVVLGSELGMQLFQNHVQCEFSSENLRFYQVLCTSTSSSTLPAGSTVGSLYAVLFCWLPRRWCHGTWT